MIRYTTRKPGDPVANINGAQIRAGYPEVIEHEGVTERTFMLKSEGWVLARVNTFGNIEQPFRSVDAAKAADLTLLYNYREGRQS